MTHLFTYFTVAVLIISAIRFASNYEGPRVSTLPLWADGGVIAVSLGLLFARLVEVMA